MYKIKKQIFFLITIMIFLCGCASNRNVAKNTKKEPLWLMNPRLVYDEARYISAVGSGLTQDLAEKSAFSSLSAIFGQRIQGETTVSERYTEALQQGKIITTEDSELTKSITTTVNMDVLIGAEIKDYWFDGIKTHHAVAVMDRAKSTILYSNLIEENEETIKKLVKIADSEKNSLDAYARYDFAYSIANANESFVTILSVLNPPAAMAKKGSLTPSTDLKLECIRIAQNVPIKVDIQNDFEGRIATSFKTVLSNQGFKVGLDNSPYELHGTFSLTPIRLGDNTNKFARYIVDAKLVETVSGKMLVPFSADGREGHATQEEANNRAIKKASQKIEADFGIAFSAYLSQLTD